MGVNNRSVVVIERQARSRAVVPLVLSLFACGAGLLEAAGVRAREAPEPTVVDQLVPVDGFRLNFRIIEGTSPVVLLEAGGGMDLTAWDGIAPELARRTGATVVSYDRAGFGESDLPEHPCEMKAEAGWMWKGLKDLGLDEDVILVGHSYGGWMIRAEADENPDAVSGMVFIDPFSTEFVDLMGVEFLDQHPMTGKPSFDTSQPEQLTKPQRALLRMVGDGLGPKTETMSKTAVPTGIPVFIIRSALPSIPEERMQRAWFQSIEMMAASIEGSVLVVAEQSDHMIPLRQPELIVETVMEVVRLAGLE